ncbi:mechanosensitive ion channel family protein [Clostridium sp. Cult2]|uniref:mechanosensitive ion channel family protein n=1 Tax=Clostridium sp. Cult2 TaxID=2079003 RepID=UPI001F15C146|nr:mechanosensitive ion channel family protein [Clostridium sp. Cult2]MCF6465697.1 mechanosensitive ion channel protein MscS [Clostridium sp. Cult2]
MNRVLNFANQFLKNKDGNLNILGKGLKIIIVFIAIRILIKVSYIVIDKTVESRKRRIFSVDEKKINTLTAVLKNIMKYVLYFIGTVIILDMFNINTNSILATAGIGGLAIGFGAQSLVRDVITGFFILFEDQFSIGDYVKIDSYEGIVEELGVRVTKLRDFSGELHIIPNGNIKIVTNKTRGAMRALVKVSIAYEEDIDRAIKVLDEVCNRLKESNESIVEGPTILGVTDLAGYGIGLTIVAKTKPMDQWSVERALRKNIKEAFDKGNIQIPYPKMVMYDNRS